MNNNDLLREYSFNDFTISTDKQKIDIEAVHRYLGEESYWAKNIPFETVKQSIEHSICLGAYTTDDRLAGFARLVTDQATFGYICDVFVLNEYRGKGISKFMMQIVCDLADEFKLRRLLLVTQDAHGLYRQSGFETYAFPERMMSRKGVVYEI